MDKYIVKLTAEERTELLNLIRVGKRAANKLMHGFYYLRMETIQKLNRP